MVSAIHCRYRALGDLPTDRQAAADWLSPAEHAAWLAMRSLDRQATWLAGRVLAKQLVAACLKDRDGQCTTISPTEIHIESRSPEKRLGARPRVFVSGQELDWGLSVAHSGRGVLVAVALDARVGVDLVSSAECRAASLAWCFSSAERRWLATLPAHGRGAERLWAMKEAIFKACHAGEGFAPQRIEIVPDSEQISSSSPAVRRLQCWRVDAHVAALAVADRPDGFRNHYPSSC
jgi:phosphopantetheinyl transferase